MLALSEHLFSTANLLKRFELFCTINNINETKKLNSCIYDNTISLKHHLDILVDKTYYIFAIMRY